MPRHTLILLQPFGVGLVAVVGTLYPVNAHKAAPVVVGAALVHMLAGRVLDDDTLMKTTRHVARRKVHLAHIDAVISTFIEVLYPIAVVGPVVKTVGAGIVRIHAGKNRRPRCHAGRARTEGVAKRKPLSGQTIHRRRAHIIAAPSADGIKALLVSHDQDDIGP